MAKRTRPKQVTITCDICGNEEVAHPQTEYTNIIKVLRNRGRSYTFDVCDSCLNDLEQNFPTNRNRRNDNG